MKKENGFKRWISKYGVLSLAIVCCAIIALTVALNVKPANTEEGTEVSTDVVKFGLPMQDAVVVKDYADDHLQYNASLNRWEIHLAVDLAAEDSKVFAVADGTVTSVESNSLDGYIVKISHADGFLSEYSSLADVTLRVGDKVGMGQQIAVASTTASNEISDGSHLHLTLYHNGVEVDPNNYLDLQNK